MWADNETKDDLLGYQVHADLLRDVVFDPKMLPISIGVFGDWGSGKSSLMLLMQESIEKWRTETEEANKVGGAAKKNARVLQITFELPRCSPYSHFSCAKLRYFSESTMLLPRII